MGMAMASFVHFLTNEVIAAPCRLLSLAWPSQEVLSHLVMKLVLAAPASFLSVAWVMQASSAKASVGAADDGESERGKRERLDHGVFSPESGRPFAAAFQP